jgi:murein peptide amidase A
VRAATVGAVTGNVLDGWQAREYGRSRQGVALRVFLPPGERPVAGLLTAAQHGEEAVTALLARRLLEQVRGSETAWAVVPVVNPDGLLAGTRQNDAGVDLNRNFPAATWLPDESFTYPPGIDPALRRPEHRTNRSSPGTSPGSEPESRALIELIERLRPRLVVDLHSPLELLLVRGEAPAAIVDLLARSANLPVTGEIAGCPGAFDDWLDDNAIPAIVYEIEQGGLPEICARHLPGLKALLRAEAS